MMTTRSTGARWTSVEPLKNKSAGFISCDLPVCSQVHWRTGNAVEFNSRIRFLRTLWRLGTGAWLQQIHRLHTVRRSRGVLLDGVMLSVAVLQAERRISRGASEPHFYPAKLTSEEAQQLAEQKQRR